MEAEGFCNDVSVKGRRWSMKDVPVHESVPGISPMAVAVATARGFDPNRFFASSLKGEMPDPSKLKGMDEAVSRFCDAVQAKKRMLLYGDYDVDGATSTSLVLRWIHRVGHEAAFYIPDRLAEGYGPNADAIRRVHAEEGIEFLLLLDSGTTAHGPLAAAAELGMEIVIIDHHEPDDRDPPGVLVNPKRRDEDRSFDYLCTAGLAFLFLVAVQREMRRRGFFDESRPEVDLREWLGIVALGTVADMVPLVGLNRAYVKAGLPRMEAIPGIRALNQANGECGYTASTCGFVFGPCINASGRIGNTRTGTMLLASDVVDGPEGVNAIAVTLVDTNRERQDIQKAALEAAIETAKGMAGDGVLVIHGPEWHPGVVGLVASKLKDAMDKPAVVIGSGGTASCRAVEGFNIGQAVIEAREAGILVKGGGHALAAGLTVLPERIADLRAFLCAKAEGFVPPATEIDLSFPCGKLAPADVESLETLEPFGMKNPRPRVAIVGGEIRSATVMKGKHLKLFVLGRHGETECIMWNGIGTPLGDALAASEGNYADIYGTARVDSFGGRRRATVMIEDAMVGRDANEEAA